MTWLDNPVERPEVEPDQSPGVRPGVRSPGVVWPLLSVEPPAIRIVRARTRKYGVVVLLTCFAARIGCYERSLKAFGRDGLHIEASVSFRKRCRVRVGFSEGR